MPGKDALNDIFQVLDEVRKGCGESVPPCCEDVGEGLAEHDVLVSKDSLQISIEDSSAIRDAAGKVLRVVLVFRDVTARRIANAN